MLAVSTLRTRKLSCQWPKTNTSEDAALTHSKRCCFIDFFPQKTTTSRRNFLVLSLPSFSCSRSSTAQAAFLKLSVREARNKRERNRNFKACKGENGHERRESLISVIRRQAAISVERFDHKTLPTRIHLTRLVAVHQRRNASIIHLIDFLFYNICFIIKYLFTSFLQKEFFFWKQEIYTTKWTFSCIM